MTYDNSLGLFGNLKKVISQATHTDTSLNNYKVENDNAVLQAQADFVESVVDEMNTLVEGE